MTPKIPSFRMVQVVPPDGQKVTPQIESLCRSLALVNAVAYFLESLDPALDLADAHKEPFIRAQIAGLARNVNTITGADAVQARADVQQLADALGIELLNLPMAHTEGTVH